MFFKLLHNEPSMKNLQTLEEYHKRSTKNGRFETF